MVSFRILALLKKIKALIFLDIRGVEFNTFIYVTLIQLLAHKLQSNVNLVTSIIT